MHYLDNTLYATERYEETYLLIQIDITPKLKTCNLTYPLYLRLFAN